MEIKKKRTNQDQEESSRAIYRKQLKEYKSKIKELEEKVDKERFAIRDAFRGMNQPAGRKKKYTPITLKNRIIDYFAMIKALDRPPTVSGLMVHLKMHRDQFYQYYEYPEFRPVMEQTKLLIENWAEEKVVLSKYNPSGLIFVLKNRFGWKDTQTVETTSLTPEDQLIARIAALAPGLLGYVGGNSVVLDAQIEEDKAREEIGEVPSIDFVEYKKARKANVPYEEWMDRKQKRKEI